MAFECVYFLQQFYCLHSECWACLHIMCQLFSVSVPAIQDNISVARSVELEWCFTLLALILRIQLTTFFSQCGVYLLHKRFVYIVYMKSFIPDWGTLKHWHPPPQMTIGMKIILIVGDSTEDRKLMIFAHKTMNFLGKDKLLKGS